MAKGTINVNQNNNRVILQDQNPKITVTDNVQNKTVNVTPQTTTVVTVQTPGPKGGFTGKFTGSANFSGSLNVDGNISASGYVSASQFVGNFTGSLLGTSSFATTASYVETSQTASHVLASNIVQPFTNITASGNISASGNITASSYTGSFVGDGSGLTNIVAAGTLSSSAQIASDISGAFTSTSASLASSISTNIVNISTNTTAIATLNNAGLLSSSAQIASNISGAFTSTSASLSSRITANEVITAKTLVSSSAQIASDISGAFTSTSASLASSITTNATNISTISASFSSSIATNTTAIATLNNAGIVSGSTYSSPSQGTLRATINGVDSDIDLGLQTGDGVQFLNITASAITASDIKANSMEVISLTSSFITASTIVTTGSNVFGDSSSDTHTFIGDIIAQNNITASGYISTDTNITASGNISASGNLEISSSITFGDGIAQIIGPGNNDYILLSNDNIDFYLNGAEAISFSPTQIIMNASNQNIDFSVAHDAPGVAAISTDASTNRVKLRDFVTIGSGSTPNADPNALLVSGSSQFVGDITASNAISASGQLRGNDLFLHAGSFDIQTGNTYTFNPSSGAGNIEFQVGSDDVIIKTNKRLEIQNTQGRLELGSTSAPTNVTMSGNISGSSISTGSFGHLIGDFGGTITNATSASLAACSDKVKTQQSTTNATFFPAFVDSNNTNPTCENVFTTPIFTVNPGEKVLVFQGKIVNKGSSITIESGSISASAGIAVTGSISSSAGSIIADAGTGSFGHLITDSGSLEFRDPVTKNITGKLSYVNNALDVTDNTNTRTAIKAADIGATGTGFNIRLLKGNLTASGNISASGLIGIETTHITSSGNITSSGTIRGVSVVGSSIVSTNLVSGTTASFSKLAGSAFSGLISSSTQLPSGLISGSSQLPSGLISGSSQLPSGLISGSSQLPNGLISSSTQLPNGIYSSSLQTLGNITSSGNIKVNGAISASKVAITSASSHIVGMSFLTSPVVGFAIGSQNANSYYQADEFHQYLSGNVIIGGATNFGGTPKLNVDGNIATDSHITASGNISSSGTIISEHLRSMDDAAVEDQLTAGRVYSVGRIRTDSHITASGNISSSSTFIGNQFNFGRANDFIRELNGGIAIKSEENRISLTGNITASNNISASGNIIGNSVEVDTGGFSTEVRTDSIRPKTSANTIIGITSGVNINGNVTASGNISSSGTIIANKIESDSLFSHVGDANTGIELSADTVKIEANNNIVGKFSTAGIELNDKILTDITASGNISSSLASTIQSGTGSFNVLKGDTTAATGLFVSGTITASGNISSSTDLEIRNITSSGNISASGYIRVNNFLSTGSYLVNNSQGWGVDNGPVTDKPSQLIFFSPSEFAGAETKVSVRDYGGSVDGTQPGAKLDVGTFGVTLRQYKDYVIPKGWSITRAKMYGNGIAKYGIFANSIFTKITGSTVKTLGPIDQTPPSLPISETSIVSDLDTLDVAAYQGQPGEYLTFQFFPASTSDELFGMAILIEPK